MRAGPAVWEMDDGVCSGSSWGDWNKGFAHDVGLPCGVCCGVSLVSGVVGGEYSKGYSIPVLHKMVNPKCPYSSGM